MEGIRPFDGPVSPFWEVQEGPSSPIVIDAWRHRQVESRSPVPCGMSQRSLGTLDATLTSIREDVRSTSVSVGALGSGDPRASSGVLSEPSSRRLDLIQAAFRRLDLHGHGWVTVQDMVAGLQHFSNMPHNERQRVLFGLCGQGLDPNTRVSISTFVGYYQMLGASIERDRDFEDLLRHHWGFAEVSTILEDMRGKFAMVGLAYAFRKHLETGDSQLSLEAFQQALSQVGMQYSSADLRGVFESLGSGAQSLEVYRLVEHVMRTPAPAAVPHTMQATATGGRRVGAGSGEASVGKLSAQLPPPTEAPAEGGKMVAASEYGAPLPEAPAEDTHGLSGMQRWKRCWHHQSVMSSASCRLRTQLRHLQRTMTVCWLQRRRMAIIWMRFLRRQGKWEATRTNSTTAVTTSTAITDPMSPNLRATDPTGIMGPMLLRVMAPQACMVKVLMAAMVAMACTARMGFSNCTNRTAATHITFQALAWHQWRLSIVSTCKSPAVKPDKW